ncbi:DUF4376 domain-containing protein [Pseudooceanicola sp. MF1-13]|uniref:DUF4376 domain-containing protein n=1 Tax=Pseudooceanicola sp. MF1-13 TaxID=3379095 RepID=UPI0038928CC3
MMWTIFSEHGTANRTYQGPRDQLEQNVRAGETWQSGNWLGHYLQNFEPHKIPDQPSDHHRWNEQAREWQDPRSDAEKRRAMLADLGRIRWGAETAGITLSGGARVATTRESQAQLTSIIMAHDMGLASGAVPFKRGDGFADLSVTQLRTMARAVVAHVQACFAAEKQVAAEIEAAANPEKIDIQARFDAVLSDLT